VLSAHSFVSETGIIRQIYQRIRKYKMETKLQGNAFKKRKEKKRKEKKRKGEKN